MKKTILAAGFIAIAFASCDKSDEKTAEPTADFNTMKSEVLADFTNKVAVASYEDLHDASEELLSSIQVLNTNSTQENLTKARNDWKEMRSIWEKCEGFLFGPVDENSYDPNMDTWPTDRVQMDSLLASTHPLTVDDIQNATLSLRGYHPIEYILFGNHGDRLPADINARQKQYMVSLAQDLSNTCRDLHMSWTSGVNPYKDQVINAGNGSDVFEKKQQAYITILEGMMGICDEVGNGKMKEPFDAQDPAIVESPYSGNSLTDFKNNIVGLQNVYMGRYKEDGKGINELVAAKNKALDQQIQTEIANAISSFDAIPSPYYEEAIINNATQVQATMASLNTLAGTLDGDLRAFIIQYIQD